MEMRESERWNQDVPGIKGWTLGDMIEEMVRHDIFDPERDTLESLYEEFERKHQNNLKKTGSTSVARRLHSPDGTMEPAKVW